MPLYVYKCNSCQLKFEELVLKYSEDFIPQCPECGSIDVNKIPSKPSLKFNGSGFYITDYEKKNDEPKD